MFLERKHQGVTPKCLLEHQTGHLRGKTVSNSLGPEHEPLIQQRFPIQGYKIQNYNMLSSNRNL